MRTYECNKCKSKDMFIQEKGTAKGLYCGGCGKWKKWLGKDEYNLAKRYCDSLLNK